MCARFVKSAEFPPNHVVTRMCENEAREKIRLRGYRMATGESGTVPSSSSQSDYSEVGETEWRSLPASVAHAAHVMLYAPWPGKFLGKYEYKFAVPMQLRFDGTLGFPGGMVDGGETPEEAATRELAEETGCGVDDDSLKVGTDDIVTTHVSKSTNLCLHFFAKEISLHKLAVVERSVVTSSSWGEEVLGLVRIPLYTLPNNLGLPAFLRNQFIGTSKMQLMAGLERRGLLSRDELVNAVKVADSINTFVTKEEINY